VNAAERPYPQPEAVIIWKMYMGLSSTNSLIFVKAGNHRKICGSTQNLFPECCSVT